MASLATYSKIELSNYFYDMLEDLCAESFFFRHFMRTGCLTSYNIWAGEEKGPRGNSIGYTSGMTKAVLISEDYDVVIKIPFLSNGRCIYREGRGTLDDIKDIEISGKLTNHCAIEALNFEKAKKAGLDNFFAPCSLLFNFEEDGFSIPVYVMDKMYCDEERISEECASSYADWYDTVRDEYVSRSSLSSSENSSYVDWNDYDAFDWIGNILIDHWGLEQYNLFNSFCQINSITDLHSGNIGYTDYNCIDVKIIDYSGYFPRYIEPDKNSLK